MLCYWSLASRAKQGWMFFRWPWDGAATLLGPSGRPLATSPAVQGAAREDGGGGAQTAAQGRKGCRRAERAGNQHHARLARYMDRAARWLQHTAPTTATGSHGGRGTVVRAEANPAASGPQRAEHGGAPRPHRGRQLQRTATTPPRQRRARRTANTDGAPKTAASSAGSNTQRKPAPLAPAHGNSGSRSKESGKRRRGGAETARRCREPSTATAAEPGERRRSPPRQRRAHSGNGGFPKRHTAARRAAHGGPDRQRRPGERRRSPTATKATDCWRLSRPNSFLERSGETRCFRCHLCAGESEPGSLAANNDLVGEMHSVRGVTESAQPKIDGSAGRRQSRPRLRFVSVEGGKPFE
jgi:hypothetical protein